MSRQPNLPQSYSFYPSEGQYPYTYVPQGVIIAGVPDQQYLSNQDPQHSTYPAFVPPRASQPQVFHQGSHHDLATDAGKHRRSRSGCLTCRSRRVKVCFILT